ncbi:MAG: LysR substrate-binding domain-containing protein, partial [Reyranellales bacterium]
TLTEAGTLMLERSRGLLRLLAHTKAEVAAGTREPTGHVSLGIPPAAGNYLIPPLVERYRGQYPRVFLQVLTGFSGYLQEWMVNGRLDVAVLHNPTPMKGVTITPLMIEQTYVVGPPDSSLGRGGPVTLRDLEGLPLILPSRSHNLRVHFEHLAAQQGVRLSLVLEVDGQSIIKALVKRGLGYSVLTQGAIHEDLKHGELIVVPFAPPGVTWTLALAERNHSPPSPIVAQLKEAIRQTCRELIEMGTWPGQSVDHPPGVRDKPAPESDNERLPQDRPEHEGPDVKTAELPRAGRRSAGERLARKQLLR